MQGLLFLILFLLFSCGGKEKNKDYTLEQKAQYSLSNKDYKKAIKYYGKLVKKHPKNKEYSKMLADSHVGFAGFELLPFLENINEILDKKVVDQHVLRNLLIFLDGYTVLNKEQVKSLETAYFLYGATSNHSRTDRLENFFKMGMVGVFSLINEINVLSKKLAPYLHYEPGDNRETLNLKKEKIIELSKDHIENIVGMFLMSYLMLRNSFEEIQHLIDKVDIVIADMFKVQFKHLERELRDLNIKKVLDLLLEHNPDLYRRIFREIDENCNPETILTHLNEAREELLKTPDEHVLILELVENSIEYVQQNPDLSCETEH